MSRSPLLVGNAQAFWGDDPDAPARLVRQQPNLDFLTLDYLAEVSMSILAIQREKNPQFGYARDFIDVVKSLVPAWKSGAHFKIVTNAGGLNPKACGAACVDLLKKADVDLRVAVVSGDDVLPILKKENRDLFSNLETGEPIAKMRERLTTANAYLGAEPIATALADGADIVITGRVADPSLTVGACLAHFDWKIDNGAGGRRATWTGGPQGRASGSERVNYDSIAGATIAGHLIECGTQACGGFSTDWLELPDNGNIGFPIVEISEDGSCVVTKPKGTGGGINLRTVKEQLLYEVGDPGNYLSPDATVSFLDLDVKEIGQDRVSVRGAKGRAPSSQYKVSATYHDGFKAHAMITIFGRNAVAKARKAGENILRQLEEQGIKFERSLVECLGSGASVPGVKIDNGAGGSRATSTGGPEGRESGSERVNHPEELMETVLRVSVADSNRGNVEQFTKKIAALVTAGPQGVTGYSAGRPKIQAVFGYWPCLIDKELIEPKIDMLSSVEAAVSAAYSPHAGGTPATTK